MLAATKEQGTIRPANVNRKYVCVREQLPVFLLPKLRAVRTD